MFIFEWEEIQTFRREILVQFRGKFIKNLEEKFSYTLELKSERNFSGGSQMRHEISKKEFKSSLHWRNQEFQMSYSDERNRWRSQRRLQRRMLKNGWNFKEKFRWNSRGGLHQGIQRRYFASYDDFSAGNILTREKDEEVERDFRGGIQKGIQRKYLFETGFRIWNTNSEETFRKKASGGYLTTPYAGPWDWTSEDRWE